jgi:hypothetical protein
MHGREVIEACPGKSALATRRQLTTAQQSNELRGNYPAIHYALARFLRLTTQAPEKTA